MVFVAEIEVVVEIVAETVVVAMTVVVVMTVVNLVGVTIVMIHNPFSLSVSCRARAVAACPGTTGWFSPIKLHR